MIDLSIEEEVFQTGCVSGCISPKDFICTCVRKVLLGARDPRRDRRLQAERCDER